jgi:hypothetical protein
MRAWSFWYGIAFILGVAWAQVADNPLGQAIGSTIDSVSSDIVPKMLAFLGLLVSVALGWAIVKVIRG